MISKKFQCLFIHIPKTAGTSIETRLGYHDHLQGRGWQDHRRLRNFQQAIWPPLRSRYKPADFARFMNQRLKGSKRGFEFLSNSEYESFFKFAIVRNPWDRVHSWYRNVLRDPAHQQELGIPSDCSFKTFVEKHLGCWALDSQLDWITNDDNSIGVDYIGRFESLADSFSEISNVLQLDNSDLPITLSSGHSDYRSAYTTELRKIIANRYADEIDYFNYQFA